MPQYNHDTVTPFQDSNLSKKQQVEQMFDNIAGNYDFLNRFMSFRIDVLWRKKTIKALRGYAPKKILDIATGTADLAIMLNELSPEKITGFDLSQQMLNVGKEKIKHRKLEHIIELIKGDSEQLPFAPESYDAVTVSFGVRNFENLDKGLSEIIKVLTPNGVLAVLEFSQVKKFPIKQFYTFYFRYITPLLGKLFSKSNDAYTYLPQSVAAFPEGEDFCNIIKKVGFKTCNYTPLSFGIATLYIAEK